MSRGVGRPKNVMGGYCIKGHHLTPVTARRQRGSDRIRCRICEKNAKAAYDARRRGGATNDGLGQNQDEYGKTYYCWQGWAVQ